MSPRSSPAGLSLPAAVPTLPRCSDALVAVPPPRPGPGRHRPGAAHRRSLPLALPGGAPGQALRRGTDDEWAGPWDVHALAGRACLERANRATVPAGGWRDLVRPFRSREALARKAAKEFEERAGHL